MEDKFNDKPEQPEFKDKEGKDERKMRRGRGRKRGGNGGKKTDQTFKTAKETQPSIRFKSAAETANDSKWYRNLLALFGDVANVSFNSTVGLPWSIRTGTPISIKGSAAKPSTTGATGKTAPGIMTITVAPTIGVTEAPTDATNIAAQQLYSQIRRANAGAKNYDPTDVMLVVCALDSAYMLYEELLRAYRILSMYNYANRYYPIHILNAIGFSASLQYEMANFRAVLDLFAYKLASINMPDAFDYIHRHSWLFTNVYTDSAQYKSQLYIIKPDGFFVYEEADGENPAYLKYVTRSTLYGSSGPVASLKAITSAIEAVMEPILGSQDVGLISGDIAKAFSTNQMIKFAPVESYPALYPSYNDEVLMSIENLQIPTFRPFTQNWDITVDYSNPAAGPFLVHQPKLGVGYGGPAGKEYLAANFANSRNFVLNMHKDRPTPDDVMVATRWMSYIAPGAPASGNPFGTYTLSSTGAEVVVSVDMYVLNTDSNEMVTYEWDTDVAIDPISGSISNFYHQPRLWSSFDWAPMAYEWSYTDSGFTFDGILGDLDNYVILTKEDVKRLNDCAMMSLFTPLI